MTNLLEAICNIVDQCNFGVSACQAGSNRANNMGDALEEYIKDAFAKTFEIRDQSERLRQFEEQFSWLGSKNNPPDIMIRGGDAIEVKKHEGPRSTIHLNSSYPKATLRCDNPMITQECRGCEEWMQKDLVYCFGQVRHQKLVSLWMLYGDVYAAKHSTYERIKNAISDGVLNIGDIAFSKTNELGRVNEVDPLKITSLRIRGMWQIENPRKVFNYVHNSDQNNNFELISIISEEKWGKFPQESKERLLGINSSLLSINDTKIKDPNNPANLIDAKIIKFIT